MARHQLRRGHHTCHANHECCHTRTHASDSRLKSPCARRCLSSAQWSSSAPVREGHVRQPFAHADNPVAFFVLLPGPPRVCAPQRAAGSRRLTLAPPVSAGQTAPAGAAGRRAGAGRRGVGQECAHAVAAVCLNLPGAH
jgi:hypothetical protein